MQGLTDQGRMSDPGPEAEVTSRAPELTNLNMRCIKIRSAISLEVDGS